MQDKGKPILKHFVTNLDQFRNAIDGALLRGPHNCNHFVYSALISDAVKEELP
jgi:hypothetical protein